MTFKSYTLVITGRDEIPSLMMTFEIGSERLAREYASKCSMQIANDKYFHFALFVTDEDQQKHVSEWDVKWVMRVEPANA